MKKSVQISIPEPCHENWAAMSTQEKGRYCAACSTVVVDFTKMSNLELIEYLAKSKGSTCGNFSQSQLDKPIIYHHNSKVEQMLRRFMLGCFTLGGLSVASAQSKLTKGKVMMTPTYQNIKGDTIVIISPKVNIEGGVFSNDLDSLPLQAKIHLMNTEIYFDTDPNGHFVIPLDSMPDKLVLAISANNYFSKVVEVDTKTLKPISIVLNRIGLRGELEFMGKIAIETPAKKSWFRRNILFFLR